ncbi:glycoside hydrolase family 5 protein [uncultured Bacteroides sp.]|uniref:glycoside hydrolase family 5 protein n=1 Tax=uncultured Bacteroides sp. TaxID=162156 RepID=UPI002620EEEA|nr:glycoside hydrolase family 5 protein [uncultured Bacteroides sp.]
MKTQIKQLKKLAHIAFALIALFTASQAWSQTPVEKNGWLEVKGQYLVNGQGEKVQLAGPSFGWHNWCYPYFNESAVTRMVQEWKASIVRSSIGLDAGEKCFDKDPQLAYATVDSMVNAAVKNGIYILIDFHSHKNNLALAKEFFSNVSRKYGKLPNLIYEVWNEPLDLTWKETKDYTETLIPLIRKNAPKSIIVVPCPHWDQDIHLAADDPITRYSNLLYSVHFYAATHKDDLRNRVHYAIGKKLPIMYSECAAVEANGNGPIDMQSWNEWMKIADENSISWITWWVCDKNESSALLCPGTPTDAKQWKESNYTQWGKTARRYMQKVADKK